MKYMLFIALLGSPYSGYSQEATSSDPVKTIDGIVKELLDLITVEKGEKPDTAAIGNLFLPSARLTVLMHHDSSFTESISVNEFISLLENPYYEQGFMEEELHKVVEQYNGIAQVFQGYHTKDSKGLEENGINCYQLVYLNNRWWIASLLWTGDSNGVELPEKYRGK